jgi:hypothetical protein
MTRIEQAGASVQQAKTIWSINLVTGKPRASYLAVWETLSGPCCPTTTSVEDEWNYGGINEHNKCNLIGNPLCFCAYTMKRICKSLDMYLGLLASNLVRTTAYRDTILLTLVMQMYKQQLQMATISPFHISAYPTFTIYFPSHLQLSHCQCTDTVSIKCHYWLFRTLKHTTVRTNAF